MTAKMRGVLDFRNFLQLVTICLLITAQKASAAGNVKEYISNRQSPSSSPAATASRSNQKQEHRIYDGAPVSGSLPFIASIQFHRPQDGTNAHFCAGSVVTPSRIATAAHCFHQLLSHPDKDSFYFTALVGTKDIEYGDEHGVSVEFKIKDVSLHSRWMNTVTADNPFPYDFAVIKLPTPLKISTGIRPIAVAKATNYPPENIMFAGWGKYDCNTLSRYLLYAVGEIISNEQCESMIAQALEIQSITLGEEKLCAVIKNPKDESLTSSVDEGDSGGPLYGSIGGKTVLLGITSFGFKNLTTGCVRHDVPQVFSRVSRSAEFLLGKNKNSASKIRAGWTLRGQTLLILLCLKLSK